MSSSNTTLPPSRWLSIRCHAVETDTAVSSLCGHHPDPAVLVGLSLAYARQRAQVPAAIALPLRQLADQGNATCRMVADWLESRIASSCEPDHLSNAIATSLKVARSPRQRALEGPRGSSPQPRSRSRGRPRSRFAKTAIIAATEENR